MGHRMTEGAKQSWWRLSQVCNCDTSSDVTMFNFREGNHVNQFTDRNGYENDILQSVKVVKPNHLRIIESNVKGSFIW